MEEIKKRPNFVLVDEYCDEDLSGAGTYRPEFERLIRDCENGKIDVVLCKSQSRFSRDMEIIEKYLHNKFIEWGVRFISVADNADTANIGNKKSRQINGLVNEWYLEDVSNNIRSAFNAKMKQGEFISPFASFGYEVSKKDNNKLVIDKEAANIVKKIFNLYLTGLGFTAIAKYLNNKNIPSPSLYKYKKGIKLNVISNREREEIKWSANAVKRILTNEIYLGHLIPNPETAPTVKKIFKWRASGIGPTEIANRLHDEGVPTPAGYKKTKYSSRLIDRDNWNISTVRKILTNRMYTGDMIQHVQTKVNYKSKKKIFLDEALWDVVENTHEPLVDRETFNYIQVLRKRNDRNYKRKTGREKRLFEGKIYCSECGNRLSVYYRSPKDIWEINCNRYSRDPVRKRCSSHFYNYDYLEEQLLEAVNEDISNNLKKVDIKKLNNEIKKRVNNDTKDIDRVIKNLEIEKQKIRDRLSMLYTDRCNDIISPNTYKELSNEAEKKLSDINFQIDEEQVKIYEIKSKSSIIPDYTKKILELLDLKKKRKELYDYIIDKIVIDEKRNISITYKYSVIPSKTFTFDETRHPNPFRRKKKD